MVDKSNEYGYVPSSPTQAYGSNTGVFQSNDVVDLINENQWSRPGQLELIQTQTGSGVTFVDFTSIQESTYNVHFMTLNNFGFYEQSQNMGFRFYESGTLETAGVYHYAFQANEVGGTTGQNKATNSDLIRLD